MQMEAPVPIAGSEVRGSNCANVMISTCLYCHRLNVMPKWCMPWNTENMLPSKFPYMTLDEIWALINTYGKTSQALYAVGKLCI